MFPTINIGPLALQSYGIILLAGLWIGLWLADRLAKHSTITSDILYNSIGVTLIAALIGGRLYYVLQNFEAFRNDLISILSLNYNLLDPWGAAVSGLLVLAIYLQRLNINLWAYLDAIIPLLATMLAAIPLANLAIGTGYGIPTELPWGIDLWGTTRHPTQIYQFIFGLGMLSWSIYQLRKRSQRRNGLLFFEFLIYASLGMILIGAFRAEQNLIFDSLRVSQVIGWFILALSLVARGYLRQDNITEEPKPQILEG